ncbi:MAG: hypothetical protein ACRDHZ_17745 [Ktedonobacteraceae bacterium]
MDQTDLMDYLLAQHPENVNKWLQHVMDGSVSVPEDFNWLGLVNGATFRAELKCMPYAQQPTLTILWARVGVNVYEYLLTVSRSSKYPDRRSLEVSLMWLRTFSIRKWGAVKDDPLLDIEQIIQWFFQDLPYSLQDLARLIEIWHAIREQPSVLRQLSEEKQITVLQWAFRAEDLTNMRLIKNKLQIIKSLLDANMLSSVQYEKVCNWTPLWENLP